MRVGPLVAASLLVASIPSARAQMSSREGIMLQNQILELRHDLDTLAQQRGGGDYNGYAAPPPSTAPASSGLESQLLDRVQTLEDQVRQLRGQLDERTNQLQQAQEQLAKQVGDLNFKLGNGSPGTSSPSPSLLQSPPPGQLGQGSAPSSGQDVLSGTPQRTPEMALQEGNAALARRDYVAAEAAAREVLARGRSTPRTPDANFLLAQAELGQRNYQGAAIAYDDAYNANHNGSRADDALLGLANALTGMGQKPAACATLDKMRREFPTPRAQLRDTAATLRARNGCG